MTQAFLHHYLSLRDPNKYKLSRYEKKTLVKPRYGKILILTEEERKSENISMLHRKNNTDLSESKWFDAVFELIFVYRIMLIQTYCLQEQRSQYSTSPSQTELEQFFMSWYRHILRSIIGTGNRIFHRRNILCKRHSPA